MSCLKSPCLWVGLLCCICGLGAICASIATDYWSVYRVPEEVRPNLTDWQVREKHFGMWKICYDNKLPANEMENVKADPRDPGVDRDDLLDGENNCIHWVLMKSGEYGLPLDEQRELHIRRSFVGTVCSSGVIQIITLIIFLLSRHLCGRRPVKSTKIYLAAAIFAMLAAVCAMTGGTLFMLERGEEALIVGLRHTYSWSFMLCWISGGLCVIQGFIFASIWGYSEDGSMDLKKQLLAY